MRIKSPLAVMSGLVPGIHVFLCPDKKDVDGRDRRAEATPFFERLCPAMTKTESFQAVDGVPSKDGRA